MLPPFMAIGKQHAITADSTAPTGVQVGSDVASPPCVFYVYNATARVIHLGWGSTAALAQTNAVAPTSGDPKSNCMALGPGLAGVFSFPAGSYFSGKASEASTFYMTPGTGI